MDYKTGEVHWKQRGLGCGSLLAAKDTLIILSEDGNLVTAKASTEAYEEISRQQILEGRCWTVPLLAHGCIYARNAAGDLVSVQLPKP